MLPSVSVPVLSVQITSVEPSVSTAVRRLTSARRAAIRRTPPASDSVIVGNRPSGTFATSRPIANVTAAASDNPASVVPAKKNTTPAPTAIAAISHATLFTWRCSGLISGLTRCDSAAIRPSCVLIAVANTTASASPAVHRVPANTTSSDSSSDAVRATASALRTTGCDSPVSAAMSSSSEPAIKRASARQTVTLGEQHHVPRNECRRRNLLLVVVPAHPRVRREQLLERLGGALGLELLRVGQRGVEQDHGHDRERQRPIAADQGQPRRHPQKQRERVGELAHELMQAARFLRARYLVGAELHQPPLGLAPAEARGSGAQMHEQRVDPLLRIHVRSPGRGAAVVAAGCGSGQDHVGHAKVGGVVDITALHRARGDDDRHR